jgi:hypothetical protein
MKVLILTIALGIACTVGWILNLVRFTQCDFKPSYKAEVIYGIGIFMPSSIVTGFIDIKDGE